MAFAFDSLTFHPVCYAWPVEFTMTVSERFKALLENLKLTSDQAEDGQTKHKGVAACLNSHYYNSSSETTNRLLVGSWGKQTRIRPPRDVDVLFSLPKSVYDRYQWRLGNKQSQLLQEVKDVLGETYSLTAVRGDGPVVVVPFTSYAVEVVPAFLLDNGQYWICNTKNGGVYENFDPNAESKNISDSDTATSGNTRHLVRMMKCWQGYCNVPLSTFRLELLAIEFLGSWEFKGHSTVYYDWMVRDFFKFLVGRVDGWVFAPGTYKSASLGSVWKSKAESAHDRAVKACQYEADSMPFSAGEEWQKIFGMDIPTG
jgi:hypothetical protein